ncbi:MAG: extracellular solute-binding protein [Pseudomonadota bacterium]
MHPRRFFILLLSLIWSGVAIAGQGQGQGLGQGSQERHGEAHGIATHGSLKYPADFAHFDVVNPDAPKGGSLRQGSMITFNSTNGLSFPGNTPNELALIYDSLMVKATDELASYYGLLAERVMLAEDYASARFVLREDARWHDGTPVTADDVVFTFETMREHGLPTFRSILSAVAVTAISPRAVEFRNANAGDRRYFGLIATSPIYPAHFWAERDAGGMTLDTPLGSGPYRVVSLELNNRVVLERVAAYWGRALAVNRGRWNFDRIETLYSRDRAPLIEALKAGRLNLHREYDPVSWAERYDGPAFENGELVKTSFETSTAGSLVALVFNQRRPPLDDIRVREALTLAFDREWARETFYGGLYARPGSLYGDGELAARGVPGPRERALLAPFRDGLPPGVFEAPGPPDPASMTRRQRLAKADALLREAGFLVRDGERVDARTGEPLSFEYVGSWTGLEPAINAYASTLERLGITLRIRLVDYVTVRQELLTHRFDLSQSGFTPSFPPGREERLGWHSERAGTQGYGLAGTVDPALDAAIEAMTDGTDMEGLVAAARVFDRVMRWRRHLLPLWRRSGAWIAHDRRIRFPENVQIGRFSHIATLWWEDED